MEKSDPIEDDPKFKDILTEAEAAAEEELKDGPHHHGLCYVFWATKQRILKEKYDIDWQSPADMNPGIDYD